MTDIPPHLQLHCRVNGCNNTFDYCSTHTPKRIYDDALTAGWATAEHSPGNPLWLCPTHKPGHQAAQVTANPDELAPAAVWDDPHLGNRLTPERCAAKAELHLLNAELALLNNLPSFDDRTRLAELWINLGRNLTPPA